jgi:hypothetical protein
MNKSRRRFLLSTSAVAVASVFPSLPMQNPCREMALKLYGTTTGRWSASMPELQNIPAGLYRATLSTMRLRKSMVEMTFQFHEAERRMNEFVHTFDLPSSGSRSNEL